MLSLLLDDNLSDEIAPTSLRSVPIFLSSAHTTGKGDDCEASVMKWFYALRRKPA